MDFSLVGVRLFTLAFFCQRNGGRKFKYLWGLEQLCSLVSKFDNCLKSRENVARRNPTWFLGGELTFSIPLATLSCPPPPLCFHPRPVGLPAPGQWTPRIMYTFRGMEIAFSRWKTGYALWTEGNLVSEFLHISLISKCLDSHDHKESSTSSFYFEWWIV